MLQRYLALLLLSGIFFLEFFQTKSLAHPATSKIEQYLEQGRTEKASALLQEFLPKNPSDPELLGLSALIRVNKGDLEAAITFYDQALTYWSDPHERLVNLNNYLLALKYQERLLNEQLKFLEIDDKLTEVKEVKGKIANNRQGQTTIRRNMATNLRRDTLREKREKWLQGLVAYSTNILPSWS